MVDFYIEMRLSGGNFLQEGLPKLMKNFVSPSLKEPPCPNTSARWSKIGLYIGLRVENGSFLNQTLLRISSLTSKHLRIGFTSWNVLQVRKSSVGGSYFGLDSMRKLEFLLAQVV